MHCWISVWGNTASIACGKPVSPSTHAINISSTAEYSDQDDFRRWRNSIGALLLLHKSINASLNDAKYDYKLKKYCSNEGNSFDFEHEGSTTSSFDSVKQFYLDAYEALGNLLVIPVALNNIKYRSDINAMNPIEKNVNSLEDYIKLTKASRYHFCLDSEVYTSFLKTLVNAKLRNAIGHNDVEYNSVDQLITYIPNPKDRTKKKTEYLLQFENEAMHMFQAILGVSEYLYRLKELELMYDGKIPIMVQERVKWPKKIGRNELCPCGSGKKYKRCHGR